MKYTKKLAKEILDINKDNTAYFDGSMTIVAPEVTRKGKPS